MDNVIRIIARKIVGETKYFPANYQAQKLATIGRSGTLTSEQLRNAELMGFRIERVNASGLGRLQKFAPIWNSSFGSTSRTV